MRNKILITLAAVACAFAATYLGRTRALAQDAPVGEFKELFNGKDLTGWEGDEKLWSVEDGVITGRTTKENPAKHNTFLVWKGGKVGDFELRVSFKINGGNSGVQYRSKALEDHVVSGYQADVDDEGKYTGILYEEKGRGILANRGEKVTIPAEGKPQVTGSLGDTKELGAIIKKGEWNDYVITARGNHFTHEINGTRMIEAIDDDADKRAAEGILALQIHAGPPMTVQFKNIRLTAIPK
jgi:hypothetical protein